MIRHTVGISYDPAAPEQITISHQGMEPFTALPLKIGPYCDKRPTLPVSMQEQTPTTSRFLDALEARYEQNQQQMGILDEAHLLEKETLEEFRFLLNCRFDSMSPMAVVLVGQTELWENKLKLQRYAAIRQRIDMYCILPHLDRSETEQYIASHIDCSGCAQEVFTTKALDEIHKASAGIPRMINRICEKALMYAF